jgi:flagellar biosynthesis/type III secretory pathway protein FliH
MGGVGQIASTAAQTAAPAVASGNNPFADIEQRIRSATGGADPAAARDAAVGAVRALVTGAAREQAAAALAQAQNIPIEQAREQVAQYEQQYRQAVEQAKQKAAAAADTAAKAATRAALFSVLALALGAIAAWFGGRAGAVDPTLTTPALGRQRRG